MTNQPGMYPKRLTSNGKNDPPKISFNIKTGRMCAKCGIFFNAPHGHPVACRFCHPRLKPHEYNQLKLATNNDLGE